MSRIRGEFGRFVLVGLLSTAVNFGAYVAAHATGLPLALATVAGYGSGLLFSFELGRRWVFRAGSPRNAATILRFAAVYIFGGLGMTLSIELLVRALGVDYRTAWLVGAAFAVVSNFAGSRQFVFNKS